MYDQKGFNMNRFKTTALIFALMIVSIFTFCSKSKIEQPKEKILVKINETLNISVNEFIRRAEYTIRPPYCKRNSYLHKKIVLNSLIAEKLFALEAGSNNYLINNTQFKNYIKGRKEQAMRQWMHHQDATNRVKIDATEINQIYPYVNREYEVEYFFIKDSTILKKCGDKLYQDTSYFNQLYQASSTKNNPVPTRKIKWHRTESENILKKLYYQPLTKGQILKPFKVEDNRFLIIKIKGWEDTKLITNTQIQEKIDDIVEILTEIKSNKIWNKYVNNLMKGKHLNFNNNTFKKVGKIFYEIYYDKNRSNHITENILDQESNMKRAIDHSIMLDILHQPLFEIDGNTWTVGDFRTALMSHPLVFRKASIPSKEFPEELKMAFVNLVEDHFITKEAYKKGYDKINVVERNTQMWQDSFLALYHKEKYLASINENRNFKNNFVKIIEEKLNTYVNSLQKKYNKKIELNFDEFEKISLTSIDLFVKQPMKPFRLVVPLFPTLTTDNYIEYLKRLDN